MTIHRPNFFIIDFPGPYYPFLQYQRCSLLFFAFTLIVS
jgi:hypothetical protein